MADPEQRLAEALRAQASGAGRSVPPRPAGPPPRPEVQPGVALLVALLAGAVLGVALALMSLLAPGVLPGLGVALIGRTGSPGTVDRVTTSAVALGPAWLDPTTIITSLGPWALVGVALIIFAECGLLLGFFLPGDSLLFTAGLLAVSTGIGAPLWLVCVVLVVAAFLGNACGYWIGRKAGPAVFDKPRSRLFKPQHVARTQEFFDRYGSRAIVLGRFVPIVRTFITVMAGVGRMDARRYLTYSAIGGVAWAVGVTLLGAVLGQIAFVRTNIELILILVVLVSLIPIGVELLRARRREKGAHRA